MNENDSKPMDAGPPKPPPTPAELDAFYAEIIRCDTKPEPGEHGLIVTDARTRDILLKP